MSVSFVILLSVLSSIAHRGSKVLVSLDALQLGANSFMVGVLAALYAVFPLLLAVYAGRISDRIGVRYPILLGSVGITAGLFLPALHGGLVTLFLCPTLIGLPHFLPRLDPQRGRVDRRCGRARQELQQLFARSVGRDLYRAVSVWLLNRYVGFPADLRRARGDIARGRAARALFPAAGAGARRASRRKTEAARARLAQGSAFAPHADHERGGAHRNRVVLLLHARLRTVDRALRLAHRPGAQRLRRGGIRGAPGDAGACEALHRSGRADRVAFYRDSYVCAFSVSFRGSDAGADGVPARIGPGLGAAAHHHADLPPRSAGTLGRGARNEADGEQDHADFDSPGVRRNRRRVRPRAGVLGQRRFSARRRNRFGEGSQRRPGIQRFTRARYPR